MSNMHPESIPLEKVVTHSSATGMRNGSIAPTLTNSAAPFARTKTQQSKKSSVFRRGGRRKVGVPLGQKEVAEDGTLHMMGKLYDRIKRSSFLIRYLFYVLPLGVAIAIPIAVGATAAKGAEIGQIRMLWLFTWIEIVWIGLWVSKLVAHCLPWLFQFLVGVVSPGIRKYSLVLKALEIPLSLVGTAVVALCTFTPLMLQNPDTEAKAKIDSKFSSILSWQNVLRQILGACLAASLVYLAERVLIQLISINYHRKQFSDKIEENKRKVYLLSTLYEASAALFPPYCNEFVEEDSSIQDALNLSTLANKRLSGSATPLRLLGEVGRGVGRAGGKVNSVFNGFAHEITGREFFNANSAHAIVIEALEKKRACEALARRIWLSFVIEGHEALHEEDMVEVLGSDRHEEAGECFAMFDRDANGDVSLEEAILTVTEIGRDRKSVSSSMHDVDQAINVLDNLLLTVIFIVVVFIFVAFLNASLTTTLATAGTALLSLSFVFATTCQEVLGSCIFLFVKHPYDIGDRIDLNMGTDQMVVEHISLLFTVFKRVNTGKKVQIPNIVLNTLWIENVSRSKAMREQISIFCAFDTTFDDIQTLREEMIKFVTAKENSRDYMPEVDIDVVGIAELNKMELRIEIRHKSNWANETVRATRRSKFMCALVLALRRVPIAPPGGSDPGMGNMANPSYSVAISPEDAQKNKDEAAHSKEAKRLIPTKVDTASTSSVETAVNAEVQAVQRMNSRAASRDMRDQVWAEVDEDNSTVHGEGRQSFDRSDRQSLEEVRGMLRRQSTRGRRQPSQSPYSPHFPTNLTPPAEETSSMLGVPPPQSRNNYVSPPTLFPAVSAPHRANSPAASGLPPRSQSIAGHHQRFPVAVAGNAFGNLQTSPIDGRGPPSAPLPNVPRKGAYDEDGRH